MYDFTFPIITFIGWVLLLIFIVGCFVIITISIIQYYRPPKCDKCGKRYKFKPKVEDIWVDCLTPGCHHILLSDGTQIHNKDYD